MCVVTQTNQYNNYTITPLYSLVVGDLDWNEFSTYYIAQFLGKFNLRKGQVGKH